MVRRIKNDFRGCGKIPPIVGYQPPIARMMPQISHGMKRPKNIRETSKRCIIFYEDDEEPKLETFYVAKIKDKLEVGIKLIGRTPENENIFRQRCERIRVKLNKSEERRLGFTEGTRPRLVVRIKKDMAVLGGKIIYKGPGGVYLDLTETYPREDRESTKDIYLEIEREVAIRENPINVLSLEDGEFFIGYNREASKFFLKTNGKRAGKILITPIKNEEKKRYTEANELEMKMLEILLDSKEISISQFSYLMKRGINSHTLGRVEKTIGRRSTREFIGEIPKLAKKLEEFSRGKRELLGVNFNDLKEFERRTNPENKIKECLRRLKIFMVNAIEGKKLMDWDVKKNKKYLQGIEDVVVRNRMGRMHVMVKMKNKTTENWEIFDHLDWGTKKKLTDHEKRIFGFNRHNCPRRVVEFHSGIPKISKGLFFEIDGKIYARVSKPTYLDKGYFIEISKGECKNYNYGRIISEVDGEFILGKHPVGDAFFVACDEVYDGHAFLSTPMRRRFNELKYKMDVLDEILNRLHIKKRITYVQYVEFKKRGIRKIMGKGYDEGTKKILNEVEKITHIMWNESDERDELLEVNLQNIREILKGKIRDEVCKELERVFS